jgi:hypothetical protein
MTIPEMKQLENRKWVFPKNEGATDFSETEYDTKEDAETAWRGWMAKQLAPPTIGPNKALSAVEIARRRAIQQGGDGIA